MRGLIARTSDLCRWRMSAAESAVSEAMSAEDLLSVPDSERFELVNGELVERPMGFEASLVGGVLLRLLGQHAHSSGRGRVANSDAGYQCFPDDPAKVRRPDVSFISMTRMPGRPPRGHCRTAPELAVEVISPNDLYSNVEAKVLEYLGAGVLLVWVVNPTTRSVRVHRADGTVTDLTDRDVLDGEAVLPGFRCAGADLF